MGWDSIAKCSLVQHGILQCGKVQYSMVEFSAVWSSCRQYGTRQYNILEIGQLQGSIVKGGILFSTVPQCTPLHFTLLYCTRTKLSSVIARYNTVYSVLKHNAVLDRMVQYNSRQFSTGYCKAKTIVFSYSIRHHILMLIQNTSIHFGTYSCKVGK